MTKNSSPDLPLWSQIIRSQTHAIVEASAGTGKTYTIEHYVLELLIERRVKLENILLVTFTDKATGELKNRIRGGIAQALQKHKKADIIDKELCDHLESNLAMVDQAPISTIHGFCLRTLQGMSYDAGLPIQTELVDDKEGLSKTWRAFLRTDWIGEYLQRTLEEQHPEQGIDLSQEAYEFAQIIFDFCGDLSEKVLKFASLWKNSSLCQNENLWEIYKKIKSDLEDYSIEMVSYRSKLLRFSLFERDHHCEIKQRALQLYSEIKELNLTTEGNRKFRDFVLKISNSQKISDFYNPAFRENKISGALSHNNFDIINGLERFADLSDLFAQVVNLHPRAAPKIELRSSPIAAYFSKIIQQIWQEQKASKGQLSFDDMIQLLAKQVRDGSDALVVNLRQKYLYGIVDEFQDTDDAQWSIFKTIFVESPIDRHGYPQNKLLVVGDPKQAIYSFRGADLETYFRAKETILACTGQSQAYVLRHNYRSTSAMIEAYNYLFNQGLNSDAARDPIQDPLWFRTEKIAYSTSDEVQAGNENFQPDIAIPQEELDKPFVILDLKGLKSAPAKYKAYAEWTCQKIIHLMEQSQKLSAKQIGQRSLSFNDFAILCRSKSGLNLFKEALSQAQIPWDIYKEEGVFQSDECYHWIVLLQAIKSGGEDLKSLRKLALSPFAGINLDLLESGAGSIQENLQSLRRQIIGWKIYADAQEWSKLIRHVNQESPYFYLAMQDHNQGDRILANLRQIQEQCLTWWIEENLSLDDVLLRLAEYHKDSERAKQDESIYQIAHEKPKVRMLTMHVSKGLEFPIVFNMMSTSLVDPNEYFIDRANGVVYFDKDADNVKEKSKSGHEQEHARLLYVSYTRASLLQYAPLFNGGDKSDHFRPLARLAKEKSAIARLETYSPQKVQWFADIGSDSDLAQNLNLLEQRLHSISEQSHPIDQYSFTKISPHGSSEENQHPRYDETENIVPENEEIVVKSTLPPGKHTGLFWHGLFEKMDWQAFLSVEDRAKLALPFNAEDEPEIRKIKSLIGHEQNKYGLGALNASQEDLAVQRRVETLEMMQRVLQAHIPDPYYLEERGYGIIPAELPSQTLCLGEISADNRKAELDFLCPIDSNGVAFPLQKSDLAGYLTGSLDLIFKHQGRYYILDWKSNFLREGYGSTSVHQAVLQSHYNLQAAIYSMALDRWLQDVEPDYDRETMFGGVIYAFVRGMGQGEGVWVRRPSPQDWESGFKSSLVNFDLQTLLRDRLEK